MKMYLVRGEGRQSSLSKPSKKKRLRQSSQMETHLIFDYFIKEIISIFDPGAFWQLIIINFWHLFNIY